MMSGILTEIRVVRVPQQRRLRQPSATGLPGNAIHLLTHQQQDPDPIATSVGTPIHQDRLEKDTVLKALQHGAIIDQVIQLQHRVCPNEIKEVGLRTDPSAHSVIDTITTTPTGLNRGGNIENTTGIGIAGVAQDHLNFRSIRYASARKKKT